MKVNVTLWIVQALLAALFLFAGLSKLVMSAEQMTAGMPVPVSVGFLRFIGVCETLGGVGMILPGLLRILPGLTPLAGAGLVVIMAGATWLTLSMGMGASALIPLMVGVLCAFVAYGRWRLAPIRG